MRARIVSLSSDDEDVETWRPPTEDFALLLVLAAGSEDGPGADLFYVTVCSLGWLAARVQDEGVVDGRHHLIVTTFSWPRIRSYIEERVSAIEGETWDEVANKLARIGAWEYEDYQP